MSNNSDHYDEPGPYQQPAQSQPQSMPLPQPQPGLQQPSLHQQQNQGRNWDGWEDSQPVMYEQHQPYRTRVEPEAQYQRQPPQAIPRGGYDYHPDYAGGGARFADPYNYQQGGGPRNNLGNVRQPYLRQQTDPHGNPNWDQQAWREEAPYVPQPRVVHETEMWDSTGQRTGYMNRQQLPHQNAMYQSRPDPYHRGPEIHTRTRGANRSVTEYPGRVSIADEGGYEPQQALYPPPYVYAASHTAMPQTFVEGPHNTTRVAMQRNDQHYGLVPAPAPRSGTDLRILRPPPAEAVYLPGGPAPQGILRSRSRGRTMQHGSQTRTLSSRKRDRNGQGFGSNPATHRSSHYVSSVQFRSTLQIDEEGFLPFNDKKGFELLIKPADPVAPQVLERQIHLLNEMQPQLLFDFLDNVNQLAKTSSAVAPTPKPEGDNTNRSESTTTATTTVPLQETGCHRFLSRFIPFLPYPTWAVGQQQQQEEGAEPGATVPIHIPTLEELSKAIAARIRTAPPQSSESRPSPGKFTETKIRTGSVPCRKFERIFIGNIKKELPLSVLQWLLDAFTLTAPAASEVRTEEEEAVKPPAEFTLATGLTYPTANYIYDAVIHRNTNTSAFKGCVHVTLATNDDPEEILHLFHKRFLFDHSGVWVATTPHEAELMMAYCNALSQAWDAGDTLIRGHLGTLPRSPVTWELVDTERRNRKMDPRTMFLQSLLDSRTRAPKKVTRFLR